MKKNVDVIFGSVALVVVLITTVWWTGHDPQFTSATDASPIQTVEGSVEGKAHAQLSSIAEVPAQSPQRSTAATDLLPADGALHLDVVPAVTEFTVSLYYSIADPLTLYEENIAGALAGDADAMLEVAHIGEYCSATDGIERVNQVDDLVASGDFTAEYGNGMRAMVETCGRIKADLASRNAQPVDNWFGFLVEWKKRSSDAGNKLATVELAMRGRHRDYEAAAKALEQAVRSGDYRAFYLANHFFGNFEQERYVARNLPYSSVESETWNYAGCLKDTHCDATVMMKNYEIRYLPSEIQEIETAAAQIEQRLLDKTPFTF